MPAELITPKPTSPADRRLKVYQFHLKRVVNREIAETLGVSERTIERDISLIRRSNLQWYQSNRTLRQRMEHLFKEQLDTKNQILREAWLTYHRADKPGAKTMALSVALNASRQIDELLGFAGLTMLSVELQETLETIDAELRGLRELAVAEKPA